MKHMISAIICCFFLSASHAFEQPVKLPEPAIEKLPNGLTIAWFASDRLPLVDISLLVKAGYRQDPAGRSGVAQLVAESIDKGCGGKSGAEIARTVESLGAERYSNADEDSFSVGMHGLAPDAEKLLEMLSLIVMKPEFPEKEFMHEHARIVDKWKHIADFNDVLAALAYDRVLSSGTPYARGPMLTSKEFAAIRRDDAVKFHAAWFIPSNSILMITGRVDRVKLGARIVELFGVWKNPEKPHKHSDIKTTHGRLEPSRGQILLIDHPGAPQAQMRIGMRAPLINDPDHYPLVVVNALVGEYFGSRLNSIARDKLGLTYAIGSSFSYDKDLSKFTITSATNSSTAGQLVSKILDILKDLRKGPVFEEEIKMSKAYLTGRFPIATAALESVASHWLAGMVLGLDPGHLSRFVASVNAVTAKDIERAITRHLDPAKAVVVVAGDAREITKSLHEAGLRSIKTVKPGELLQ